MLEFPSHVQPPASLVVLVCLVFPVLFSFSFFICSTHFRPPQSVYRLDWSFVIAINGNTYSGYSVLRGIEMILS